LGLADDADIAEPALVRQPEQAADAGPVDLDRKVVVFRVCSGERGGAGALAGTDVQHPRRMTPEQAGEIELRSGVLDAETGPAVLQRLRLSRGEPALPEDVTAYVTGWPVPGHG